MESIDHQRWLERIESALHELREVPGFDRPAVPEQALGRATDDESAAHSEVSGDSA